MCTEQKYIVLLNSLHPRMVPSKSDCDFACTKQSRSSDGIRMNISSNIWQGSNAVRNASILSLLARHRENTTCHERTSFATVEAPYFSRAAVQCLEI